jgi:hypothetical protein
VVTRGWWEGGHWSEDRKFHLYKISKLKRSLYKVVTIHNNNVVLKILLRG